MLQFTDILSKNLKSTARNYQFLVNYFVLYSLAHIQGTVYCHSKRRAFVAISCSPEHLRTSQLYAREFLILQTREFYRAHKNEFFFRRKFFHVPLAEIQKFFSYWARGICCMSEYMTTNGLNVFRFGKLFWEAFLSSYSCI